MESEPSKYLQVIEPKRVFVVQVEPLKEGLKLSNVQIVFGDPKDVVVESRHDVVVVALKKMQVMTSQLTKVAGLRS